MKKLSNISFIVNIALIFFIVFFLKKCTPEIPEPEVKIEYVEIEVPKIEDSIPAIINPEPKTITIIKTTIDSIYYQQYVDLKDQVQKDSLFKKSVQINEYSLPFEDENIKLDIYSKTRGILLEQKPNYTIKPTTVTVPQKTIIYTKPEKFNFYAGGSLGIPTQPNGNFLFKGTLGIQDKKGTIYTGSIDNEKNIYVGGLIKLW